MQPHGERHDSIEKARPANGARFFLPSFILTDQRLAKPRT